MAVTVAVLALGALIGGIKTELVGGRRAAAYVDATILAESTLDTMGTASKLIDGDQAVQQSGIFHIQAAVTRTDTIPGRYVVPYLLTATVSWLEGTQSRAVTLRTIRLGPVH